MKLIYFDFRIASQYFTIYCSNILKYLFWLFLLQEINFIDLAFDLEIAFHPAATLLPFPAPYGIAWYGVVLYGVVWYCMPFLGMAWHGIVWYPVQPFYPSQHPWHAFHCRCSITILNHVQKIVLWYKMAQNQILDFKEITILNVYNIYKSAIVVIPTPFLNQNISTCPW